VDSHIYPKDSFQISHRKIRMVVMSKVNMKGGTDGSCHYTSTYFRQQPLSLEEKKKKQQKTLAVHHASCHPKSNLLPL
jgi:hypothetical protein